MKSVQMEKQNQWMLGDQNLTLQNIHTDDYSVIPVKHPFSYTEINFWNFYISTPKFDFYDSSGGPSAL